MHANYILAASRLQGVMLVLVQQKKIKLFFYIFMYFMSASQNIL